ncbi:hypothetical protein [Paraburkholderia terrae]|uniref:hypothetical protein n=1 Tax=Paraburkholderia terrae TaxID=311230 RepID=UPI0020520AD0|nr:hypothetical protein [Paraburkholderia terrae]BDC39179.1 hypothetical protein PTKU15_24760 [Paraburkholderia terrae]
MSTEYLRDAHYHFIGTIETWAEAKQITRDAHYHRVGEFEPRLNQTRDSHYRLVGTGNQLPALNGRVAE